MSCDQRHARFGEQLPDVELAERVERRRTLAGQVAGLEARVGRSSERSERYSAPNATPSPSFAVGSLMPYWPRSPATEALSTCSIVEPSGQRGICRYASWSGVTRADAEDVVRHAGRIVVRQVRIRIDAADRLADSGRPTAVSDLRMREREKSFW